MYILFYSILDLTNGCIFFHFAISTTKRGKYNINIIYMIKGVNRQGYKIRYQARIQV